MYLRAIETRADAVIPDVVFHRGGADDRRLAGFLGDRSAVITGREATIRSLTWDVPGNALWRTGVVREIGYDMPGANGDELAVRMFFNRCGRVAFSTGTFFYEQGNPEAVTKATHPRLFDFPLTSLRLSEFLRQQGYPEEIFAPVAVGAALDLLAVRRRFLEEHVALSPEAAQRVEQCLTQLRSPLIRELVRSAGGWRNRAAALITTHGSPVFRIGVRIVASGATMKAALRAMARKLRR